MVLAFTFTFIITPASVVIVIIKRLNITHLKKLSIYGLNVLGGLVGDIGYRFYNIYF